MKKRKIVILTSLVGVGVILIFLGLIILFYSVPISIQLDKANMMNNIKVDSVLYVLIVSIVNVVLGCLFLSISSLKLIDVIYEL